MLRLTMKVILLGAIISSSASALEPSTAGRTTIDTLLPSPSPTPSLSCTYRLIGRLGRCHRRYARCRRARGPFNLFRCVAGRVRCTEKADKEYSECLENERTDEIQWLETVA